MRLCGLFGVLGGDGFAAGVFGVRRVVGMGGVFARVFLVGQFVMGQVSVGGFSVGRLFVGVFSVSIRAGRPGSPDASSADEAGVSGCHSAAEVSVACGLIPIGMFMFVVMMMSVGVIIMAVIVLMMGMVVLMGV